MGAKGSGLTMSYWRLYSCHQSFKQASFCSQFLCAFLPSHTPTTCSFNNPFHFLISFGLHIQKGFLYPVLFLKLPSLLAFFFFFKSNTFTIILAFYYFFPIEKNNRESVSTIVSPWNNEAKHTLQKKYLDLVIFQQILFLLLLRFPFCPIPQPDFTRKPFPSLLCQNSIETMLLITLSKRTKKKTSLSRNTVEATEWT